MWPCLFHAPGQSLGNPRGAVSRFSLPQAAAFYTRVKQSIWVLPSSGSLARVFPFSRSQESFFTYESGYSNSCLKILLHNPVYHHPWNSGFSSPNILLWSYDQDANWSWLLRKVLSTWSRMQVPAERESLSWWNNGNILSKNNYNFKRNLLWRAGGKWNLMEVSRHL